MKKFLLSALILLSGMSYAQIDLSNTRYGVTGGFNYSRVRYAHNPSGPRYTFQVGGLALIPLGNDDQFYLQPELTYYGAGETGRDSGSKNRVGYNAVYANNYISLPIYFKGYFTNAESEFFALAGPRFNFLVNQSVKNAPQRYTIEGGDPLAPGVNGKAKGFNFALGAGIGFSYKRTLELSVRYDVGLSNTYPQMIETTVNDPNTTKRKSEQVLSAVLSYIFE